MSKNFHSWVADFLKFCGFLDWIIEESNWKEKFSRNKFGTINGKVQSLNLELSSHHSKICQFCTFSRMFPDFFTSKFDLLTPSNHQRHHLVVLCWNFLGKTANNLKLIFVVFCWFRKIIRTLSYTFKIYKTI